MSYTRTLHSQAYWHTSGTVSYPASESGGRVSYSDSGYIPIDINVHVDTVPFDASVVATNKLLLDLNENVAQTGVEHCKAIDTSSRQIAKHISGGFFSLVKSELSQNMAELFSKLNSSIGLILERTKSVKSQKQTMEKDYNRTLSRYQKVFTQLDEECKKRVVELDKAAWTLSTKVLNEQISQTQLQSGAGVMTGLCDTNFVNTKMALSHTKSRCAAVLRAMANNIYQESHYAKQLSVILQDTTQSEFFIPILYVKTSDIENKTGQTETCYINSFTSSVTDEIANTVLSSIHENAITVEQSQGEKESIKKELNSLCESYLNESGEDEDKKRIYEIIMKLAK